MTRHWALFAVLAVAVVAGGCVEFGGSGRTSVSVDATTVEAAPENATVVPVTDDRIAGTPLEALVREAAANGSASTTVPPERSDAVATAADRLPRDTHPTTAYGDGSYVGVDGTVVFVEVEWPA